KSLPPQEQELVKELTNFADLCKYFEEHNQDLDPSVARAVSEAATLPLEDRIVRIREINQRLMEVVNNAAERTRFRNYTVCTLGPRTGRGSPPRSVLQL